MRDVLITWVMATQEKEFEYKSLDFKEFLTSELSQRCQLNPQYSLRAFARFLGVESSYLSKILRGTREVTPKLVSRLSPKFELNLEEKNLFLSQLTHLKKSKHISPVVMQNLPEDFFYIVSDWYHDAILELTHLDGFQLNAQWIADQINIPAPAAAQAIDRLIRVGLLVQNKTSNWVVSNNFTTTHFSGSTALLKKLQRSILQKALLALENVPFDQRHQSSVTFAINSADLPKAHRLAKTFRQRMMKILENNPRKNTVYQLSVSLFPLSKINQEKTNA